VTAPVTANYGRAYVGVSAGLFIPQNIHVTVSGADNGSFDQSFQTGAAVSGYVGYYITNNIAVEGELAYASADTDTISGSLNGFGFGVPVSGHVSTVTGFANAVWRPLGRFGISPYLGGGIGLASTDLTINSFGVTSSGSQTDFALNGLIGVDFAIGNRFTLGGRYRLLWVNAGRSTSDGFDTVTSDNVIAHILTVNGTFRF
jgi:hypothetical protein